MAEALFREGKKLGEEGRIPDACKKFKESQRLDPTLGTLLAFTTSQAVLALAALGFVGVGMQPPTPELGLMMTEALPYYEEAQWLIAAPTTLMVWLVAAMMLLNPDRETACARL